MLRSPASALNAPRLLRSAVVAAASGALIVVTGAAIAVGWLPFGFAFAAAAFSLYLLAAGTMVLRIQDLHPHARFGMANGVTLVRLAGTCLYAGLALELALDSSVDPSVLWAFAAFAIVIVSLDGLDGYLARRQELVSDFGARFDHEVDTLLLLLLSVLAFLLGKAGAWVLLIGAMRYLFVAAGRLWPALRQPLPPSRRREAVCVVQGVVLLALLSPILTPPASTLLAAAALALLTLSFAADVVRLAEHRGA